MRKKLLFAQYLQILNNLKFINIIVKENIIVLKW